MSASLKELTGFQIAQGSVCCIHFEQNDPRSYILNSERHKIEGMEKSDINTKAR